MQKAIENTVNCFLEKIRNKKVRIISHYDTDGITSAAIFSQTLKKLDKRFSVKIVKALEKDSVKELDTSDIIVLLDLGSSCLEELAALNTDVFVIDHHEICGKPGKNTFFLNPHVFNEETIS